MQRLRRLGGCLADRTGITLMESLIACLVVGIAAVGLATMFAHGQGIIGAEGDNRVAVYLAQQEIELRRALGFAALTTIPTEYFSRSMAVVASSNAFYTRSGIVECVDATDYTSVVDCATLGHAKRVTVTVQSAPAASRNVTLQGVLADR